MKYSKYQENIFDWVKNGTGNCIVQAVAGSGKTTSALECLNHLSGSALFLAFNKKIAVELQTRIKHPTARAATFHSEGLQNLIKSKGRVNVNNSKVYYILKNMAESQDYAYIDDRDMAAALPFIQKLVGFAKEYAFGVEGQRAIDDNEAWMEIIQTQDISLDSDMDFGTAIELAKDVLKVSNSDFRNIDFADMIYLTLIYKIKCIQYDWVIVDEAQDTNVSRKLFIAKLLKDRGRLIAIGDENQAIYMFCGAENNSMNLIKDMFNCVSLPLSVCYRCGKNIVEEAKKYQPHIEAFENAKEGEISSMRYDDLLSQALSLNLSDKDGIICRNNAPNVALAFALIRLGIGCRIEGKDIGQSLLTLCNKWRRVSDLNDFTEKLVVFFNKEFDKASKAKMAMLEDKLQTMVILIERCQSLGHTTVDSLRALIEEMFTDNGDPKTANLVTLSSIHKAKGLQFDTVYTIGNSQLIPSRYATTDAQLEQEMNLAYISITRAISKLVYITDIPMRGGKNPQE